MPVGAFVPSRIHLDYPEWQTPVIGDTGKVWAYTGSGYAPASFLLASAVSAFGATLIDDADAATARATLGLGTAAVLNVGTGANNIVQLDGSAKLPAVDGSLLTNLPGGAVAGSTTQVIYNNAGAYAGHSGMTYNSAASALTVSGYVITPAIRPASDSTTALQLQKAAGTAVVTVDTTNSRMGIGTTPLSPLHVVDNSGNGFLLERTSATAKRWLHYIGSDGSYHIYDYTLGAERFVIDATGNWALGQVTANNRLTVLGSADISGSLGLGITAPLSKLHVIDNGGNGFKLEKTSGTVRKWMQLIGSNGFFHLYDDTAATFSITADTNGRIGIGNAVTAPTALLDLAASSTTRSSLRIRAGTAPTTPNAGDIWDDGALVAYNINATTNAVANSLKLRQGSSGTPAAGFGLGISARLESSTTEDQDAGRLTFAWVTATHATRASRGKLTAYYTTTEQEAMTWDGDAGGLKLAFYPGVTPVARQLLATGAGATVDDVIQALQNLGLLKQS